MFPNAIEFKIEIVAGEDKALAVGSLLVHGNLPTLNNCPCSGLAAFVHGTQVLSVAALSCVSLSHKFAHH